MRVYSKKKTSRHKKHEATFNSTERHERNPIMCPDSAIPWSSWQVFNPGAVVLDGRVHLIYRAIGGDGISRFGYASSPDGFHMDEVEPEPVYTETSEVPARPRYSPTSGGSLAGCEDPRLVHIEEDGRVYMTYTSCLEGLRMAITSISVEDFLAKNWDAWSPAQYMSQPDQVHKNWVLFPEKIGGKYAICHSLNPLSIEYRDTLDFSDGSYIRSTFRQSEPSERWDSYMRGAGAPPLRTDDGWLLFYHAMNHADMSRYKIGAMLLDLNDPEKILHRSPKPVIVPQASCEIDGYKGGVVYASGSVIKDGKLLLYYGGADRCICVTHADLNDFLRELKSGVQQSLGRRLAFTLLKCFRLQVWKR